jgi:predicted HTH transcriptional regulator
MKNIDFLKEVILQIPAEEESIEFKRVLGSGCVSKVVETIVAMSNGNGGSIILGIGDPEKDLNKGINRVYGIDEDVVKILMHIGREK